MLTKCIALSPWIEIYPVDSCSAFEKMVLGCQKIIPCFREQFLWGLPSPKRSGKKMTVSPMPQPCIVVFSLITHS